MMQARSRPVGASRAATAGQAAAGVAQASGPIVAAASRESDSWRRVIDASIGAWPLEEDAQLVPCLLGD